MHGFTPMLALSGLTLALGGAALAGWPALRRSLAGWPIIDRWGTDTAYDHAIQGLQRVAAWQTRRIQTGSLRRYLGTFFAVTSVCLLVTLWLRGGFAVAWPSWAEVGPEAALPLLLVLASAAVLRAASFMAGIVTAGMVGFIVALTFLYRGAPDLAFTQFSVEALAIVILLAIVGRMPFHEVDPRRRGERRRDAVIATGFGLVATLVLLAVVATPFDARLSDFFRTASVPEAHGRNLVNVIIVDFRALDTLGEIAVLALSALAAAAVISSVRARQADDKEAA
jgi:multicomponent Na+:H+ antiporter subunit A